jgi:mono/diheme cytochrome c family protein
MKTSLLLLRLTALLVGTASVLCAHHDDAPAKGTPGKVEAGKKIYQQICIACHGPDGAGVPSVFPPLAGSEILTAADSARIIRIVLQGLTGPVTVKGKEFQGAMPGLAAAYKDAQIADVLTYARQAWGNPAGPVTVEAVTAAREQTKARTTMWTWSELVAATPEKKAN